MAIVLLVATFGPVLIAACGGGGGGSEPDARPIDSIRRPDARIPDAPRPIDAYIPDAYIPDASKAVITATDCTVTGAEATDITGSVLLACSATDSDPTATLSVTVITPPANAQTFTVGSDGTFHYLGSLMFFGNDPATLMISDNKNGTPVMVTMTVTVTKDPAPTCTPFAVTTGEGTSTSVGTGQVLANCTSPSGFTLDITSVTQGTHGTVVLSGGVISYTPAAGFSGGDSFTATVVDEHGGTYTAVVTVTVVAPKTPTPILMVSFSAGGWLPYFFLHPLPPGMFHAFDTTTGLGAGTANVTIPGIDAGIKTCLTTADGNFCYVGAGALVPYQITTGPLLTETTPNTLIPNIVSVERAMASVHTATGDFVYALARIMQASGPDVFDIFQFKVVSGALVPLSPAAVVVLPAGNSLAIDPSGKFLYANGYATATGASGQALTVSGPSIQQLAINSDGTLAALSPATLALPRANALTSHLAISADGASLYEPGFDGAGNFIAQYTRQADGTLVAQTPAIVATTVNPFELALTGAFAYAVDISGSILELSVNATGGLAPVATFPLAMCTHASNLTLDPVDQLLLVPCPQPGNVQALDINSDGSLTPTSWSPQVLPGQIPANTYYFAPLL